MVNITIVWIGSGVPMLKFDRFSESAGVLLVSPLGVGGSISQILIISQKYYEFDIVSKPKVLPPPVCSMCSMCSMRSMCSMCILATKAISSNTVEK